MNTKTAPAGESDDARQAIKDLLTHGVSVMQDGKRIAPADFYKEPEPSGELSDADIPAIGATGEKVYDMDLDMWVATQCRQDEINFARAAIAADRARRQDAEVWSSYVAGMVEAYLQSEPSADKREAAIAGIIGRRVWALSGGPDRAQRQAGPTDLHAAIMNLPCAVAGILIEECPVKAYHLGHRDARHAAAELVVQRQAQQEPVARIEGIDEYGPRLEWLTHWVDVGVGTKLYTAPQPAAGCGPVTEEDVEAAFVSACGTGEYTTPHFRAYMRRALEGFAAGRVAAPPPAVPDGLLRELRDALALNDRHPEQCGTWEQWIAKIDAAMLLAAPQHVSSLPSTPQPDKPNPDAEQAAFEHWLQEKCPSGDCESVHCQWLESGEYAGLLDQQSSKPAVQPAAVTLTPEILADKIVDLVELMGNDPETTKKIDVRAWHHLLVYAPRCPYCDGTGDVHDSAGEWRGACNCQVQARPTTTAQPSIHAGLQAIDGDLTTSPAPGRKPLTPEQIEEICIDVYLGETHGKPVTKLDRAKAIAIAVQAKLGIIGEPC